MPQVQWSDVIEAFSDHPSQLHDHVSWMSSMLALKYEVWIWGFRQFWWFLLSRFPLKLTRVLLIMCVFLPFGMKGIYVAKENLTIIQVPQRLGSIVLKRFLTHTVLKPFFMNCSPWQEPYLTLWGWRTGVTALRVAIYILLINMFPSPNSESMAVSPAGSPEPKWGSQKQGQISSVWDGCEISH